VDPRLQKLQKEIAFSIAGLTGSQWTSRPAGKWCAAEILEHLYLTYTGTIKGFSRVAEAQKPLATSPTWMQRGRRWIVLGLGYFPSGRQAPPFTRPRGAATENVKSEIGPKIAEMDDMIAHCELQLGKDSNLLDHPILGPLSGAQWRKFHLVHGLHHLKQIRKLRAGQEK
jgi:Protein of unknown function (DUF1569)